MSQTAKTIILTVFVINQKLDKPHICEIPDNIHDVTPDHHSIRVHVKSFFEFVKETLSTYLETAFRGFIENCDEFSGKNMS